MPAPLNPALPTHDLRSGARASKRDKRHNAKWQHGVMTKSIKGCPQKPNPLVTSCCCGQCHTKPVGPYSHNHSQVKAQKLSKKDLRCQTSTLARKAFRNDLVDALDPSPTSSDDDTAASDAYAAEAAAPLPAADPFLYSYDKPSGPSDGQHILSSAVTAAVMRFENTQTEKLVSTEYDVIDGAEETAHVAATTEDDEDQHDFELIEHAHLE